MEKSNLLYLILFVVSLDFFNNQDLFNFESMGNSAYNFFVEKIKVLWSDQHNSNNFIPASFLVIFCKTSFEVLKVSI